MGELSAGLRRPRTQLLIAGPLRGRGGLLCRAKLFRRGRGPAGALSAPRESIRAAVRRGTKGIRKGVKAPSTIDADVGAARRCSRLPLLVDESRIVRAPRDS